MQLSRDEDAQSTIDFLFGLAVFLMAFLYVFTFVPGLFVPYQASAVDLSSVGYKTSTMLVEDPGWYIYTDPVSGDKMGSAAWETMDIDKLARIGLAVDRQSPNVLSMDKIGELAYISSRGVIPELGGISSYDVIRDKIGLAGTLTYNFSLNLAINNTLTGNRNQTLLNITTWPKGDSIEYMERNVMVDEGREMFVDAKAVADHSALMKVNLSERQVNDYENVTLRIFNVTGASSIVEVMWKSNQGDPTVPLQYKVQYLIRVDGKDVQSLPASFGPANQVEIIVYNTAIRHFNINYLWVHAGTTELPDGLYNYYNDPVFKLKRVYYQGVFKVEVWPNEII